MRQRNAFKKVNMSTLVNNAHYLVEVVYQSWACSGANPTGRIVRIRRKRNNEQIEITLSVFERIAASVEKWKFGQ